MKCIVGMSGGVDSSVVAALAKKRGYDVVGCTLKMFDSERTEKAIKDARGVASYLGIHHKVVDCQKLFKRHVQDYFVDLYANGETPNPCIMCNEYVKFAMLDTIRTHYKADVFMTGHYAKLTHQNGHVELHQAADLQKDQSYFLYRVDHDKLIHARFPLGNFRKTQTRQLAKKFGLCVAEKSDSQDVCFILSGDYKSFLKCQKSFRPGNIVDEFGTVLGHHYGIINYTLGQRKGLGLAGGPFFVKSLDVQNNRVIVSDRKSLEISEVLLKNVKFINEPITGQCEVKIRATGEKIRATLSKVDDNYYVSLLHATLRPSPGQHCVFYQGDNVLGGGIIRKS